MLWLVLLGCDDTHSVDSDVGDSAIIVGTLSDFTVEQDPHLPNVFHTTWNGGEGRGRVEYGLDGALDQATPWGSAERADVVGLKSGRVYTLRAVTVDDAGSERVSDTVEVEVDPSSSDLPVITVEESDPSGWVGEGYVLLTIFDSGGSWLAVIDREGDYVWTLPARPGSVIPTAHFTRDGKGVIYVDNDFTGYGWGGIGHATFDGTINEYREIPAVHHDAIDLPDGGYAWLEFETRSVELEEGDTQEITTDAVYDAPDFYGEPRKVFSMFDDYGHRAWHVCSHSEEPVPVAGGSDFTHGNSLVYDEAADRYLYMAKHLDGIIGIDRASAEMQFQAGGRFGDFTDVDGDVIDPVDSYLVDGPNHTWWSHAHMSAAWDGGFVLYDNGYHHSPLVSRAAAYEWDTDAHTLRRTFSFTSETGAYDPVLGDVRPLDNGNWLISWTLQGMLTEVTPEGTVVWRASTTLGSALGRTGYLSTLYGEE